jgi:phosphohistidine swiveling domain-containing protein
VPLAPERHGLKAFGLDRALRLGERVPPAFALDCVQARQIAAGDAHACAQLERALTDLRDAAQGESITLAVRASPTLALPGALQTQLDVPADLASVAQAVAEVLGSAEAPPVQAQLDAQGLQRPDEPWLALLIQRQLRFGAGDFGAVLFTHDTYTGDPRLHGEYTPEGVVGVVSGRTRPRPLEAAAAGFAAEHPDAWQRLAELAQRLGASFDEPLDLELGYCNGAPWLLEVRPLVFGARALVRLGLRAIEEDSPLYARWLRQLSQRGLSGLASHQLDPSAASTATPLLRGVAASPGAAHGVLVTDVERACQRARHTPVILLRPDAVPEDVAGFRAAAAVVTTSGGLTCHAAVIARGLGVPAVVGASGARIDLKQRALWGGRDGRTLVAREGDWLSVDARKGLVYPGRLPLQPQIADPELKQLFVEVRKLRPTSLWVSGPAPEALRLKDEACLDGALCTWPAQGELPPGQGRECWIEIPAAEIQARVPALPRGWGVVVTGDLEGLSVAALRRSFPLRALGVRFDSEEATLPDAPLDLVVVGAAAGPLQKSVEALRQVHMVNFSGDPPVLPGNNVGWACPVSTVALMALGYATVRAVRA